MDKRWWLEFAEVFDALRIVPRLLLLGYATFCLWYVERVTAWFFALDATGWGETTFISVTFPALFGMAGWITKIYIRSGRKWGEMNGDS